MLVVHRKTFACNDILSINTQTFSEHNYLYRVTRFEQKINKQIHEETKTNNILMPHENIVCTAITHNKETANKVLSESICVTAVNKRTTMYEQLFCVAGFATNSIKRVQRKLWNYKTVLWTVHKARISVHFVNSSQVLDCGSRCLWVVALEGKLESTAGKVVVFSVEKAWHDSLNSERSDLYSIYRPRYSVNVCFWLYKHSVLVLPSVASVFCLVVLHLFRMFIVWARSCTTNTLKK